MRPAFWISFCLAAWGLHASSQTLAVITACVNNLNGVPRLVLSPSNCINNLETYRQWDVTGPQGPAGPSGPTGPTGPAGPSGGQIFMGNQSLPANISGMQGYSYPFVGTAAAPLSDAAALLQRPPNVCGTTQSFTATVLNAPGTSFANIYELFGVLNPDGSLSLNVYPLCSVKANSGKVVSCTTTANLYLDVSNAPYLALYVVADSGFQGANIITQLACQ